MKARERERERERERSVLRSEHETITKRTHRNHDARSRERERKDLRAPQKCALPKREMPRLERSASSHKAGDLIRIRKLPREREREKDIATI